MTDKWMVGLMNGQMDRWTDRKKEWINELTDVFVLKCKMDASYKKWTDFKPPLQWIYS